MGRMAFIAGLIYCLGLNAQTLTQENLYAEYQNASFAKSLSLVKGQELSCRYVSMLEGSYHDLDYDLLIEQEGIKARSSKGTERFDLSGPLQTLSDRIYSEKVDSSFVGWMLGHRPAIFKYQYKFLGNHLFIAKSSKVERPKSKQSRVIFRPADNEALLSLYKCDIAKQRSVATIESNDGARSAKEPSELQSSSKALGSRTEAN